MKQTPTIFEFSDAIQDPKKKTDLDSIKNPYSKTTTQPKTLCFGWRVLNSLKNFKATSINITIQDLNSLKPKFNNIKTKRQSEFQGSEYIEIQETKKRKWKTRMLKMKEERERERLPCRSWSWWKRQCRQHRLLWCSWNQRRLSCLIQRCNPSPSTRDPWMRFSPDLFSDSDFKSNKERN